MKINHTNIKALKPCDSRYENFKKHYPEFDSDLTEFLYLEEISYSDKVWVFTRLATKEQNIKWAIMCAESVLQHFETKYPQDLRPRAALEASEAYIINPTKENKRAAANAATAAYAAAYAANVATYAAANAAANAATYAANAAAAIYATYVYAATNTATYAANAATYAVYADNAATYAATYAAYADNAATYAAADAATYAAYADNAATYAATYAAYADTYAAADAAEKQQKQLNLMFMIEATS